MQESSDETLFVAFQQHRDVASLSTLFRRRADELLRLAVFLAPRPTDAEDLVQATFLSAIARAETYRDGYRVMSWLCGILTNHARMLRRAERRVLPTPAQTAEAYDPMAEALRSELRQSLQRSITELGEPYRSVLALHLDDGLNSREISERLRRPPATVRKQMARALERLRQALPLGLATALVVKMNPAQVALHAAEAAQFVDVSGPVTAADAVADEFDDAGMWCEAASNPVRTWLLLGLAAVAAVVVTIFVWPSSPSIDQGSLPEATVVAETLAEPEAGSAIEFVAAPLRESAPLAEESYALEVTAADPDGVPHAEIELICILDDGRAMPTRLQLGEVRRSTTDKAGIARFEGLVPGRYQLAIAGCLANKGVRVIDKDVGLAMTIPTRREYSGTVTDAGGRPVAGATVLVSETGGRGELPHAIAVTDATGYYQGSCLMWHGQIFARHPQHSQSPCRRLIPGRPIQLELEPRTDDVNVRVVDHKGRPVAGCAVAVVPKSQSTQFLVPHVQTTGGHGTCTLPGPGDRHATVVVQRDGMAPARVDLASGVKELELVMAPSRRVEGFVKTHDGQSLANQEVVLSAPGTRTNEPIGPMLALRSRTDKFGRFAFAHAPRGELHARIYSRTDVAGPPMSQYVVAGVSIDTREGDRLDVELTARKMTTIRGTVRTSDGAAVSGYHILAIPDLGTAAHRMFRRRAVRTDEDGRFELDDVAADEAYHLGVYPPERWWPNQLTWPVVIKTADCKAPCEIVLTAGDVPSSSLTCQVLRPDGKAARRATMELRHLSYHAPLVSNVDASGVASFSNMLAGDYWLIVKAPGLGSRTKQITIDSDRHALDLGVIQMQRAARIAVRTVGRPRGANGRIRVVGRSVLGDKFVSATTRGDGVAGLPPLPPGKSRLLLHGPGVAPCEVEQEFEQGLQWIDVELETANAVTLRMPFPRAQNPFIINGPLHVRVFDEAGRLILEDHVGATTVPGRFDLATGLRPGRYRVRARTIWNALGEQEIVVPASGAPVTAVIPLEQ